MYQCILKKLNNLKLPSSTICNCSHTSSFFFLFFLLWITFFNSLKWWTLMPLVTTGLHCFSMNFGCSGNDNNNNATPFPLLSLSVSETKPCFVSITKSGNIYIQLMRRPLSCLCTWTITLFLYGNGKWWFKCSNLSKCKKVGAPRLEKKTNLRLVFDKQQRVCELLTELLSAKKKKKRRECLLRQIPTFWLSPLWSRFFIPFLTSLHLKMVTQSLHHPLQIVYRFYFFYLFFYEVLLFFLIFFSCFLRRHYFLERS